MSKEQKPKTANKEIERLTQIIPEKQLEFVNLYLSGHTPLACVQLSGLGSGDSQADAAMARSIIRAPAIKMYLSALKMRVAEKSIMTLEDIDKRLTSIASVGIMDVVKIGEKDITEFDNEGNAITRTVPDINLVDDSEITAAQKAAIKSIKVVKNELHIELHDSVKAMDMLIRRSVGYKEESTINLKGNVQVFAAIDDNGRGPKKR